MTAVTDRRPPGAMKITIEQQRRFDEDGYFVVNDALSPAEVDRLIEVVDAVADGVRRKRDLPAAGPLRVRNIVVRDPAFRDLLDHPAILPLVVDVFGTRIQLRGSNLDVRPPIPADARADGPNPSDFALHWHRDEPAGGWPTVDGVVPFMEIKVGLYLTDLTSPHSGALRVVAGSHRRPAPTGPHGATEVDRQRLVEINVAPGAALIWRTSLLHDVASNHSDRTRKCLYLAYQHRWLRPSDYITAPDDVLAACNPVQRQLLGSVPEPASFLKYADVEPCSTYWTPSRADLPLQEWAEQHGLGADRTPNHVITSE